MIILRIILFPISLIYSICIFLRNRCYDLHLLPSEHPEVFTLVIGNLTVGGTGKTPFTAHVLGNVLTDQVAFLSRGYGRKTKGLMMVDPSKSAADIGDEPLLIHRRFPTIPALVSENRIAGIHKLRGAFPDLKAIVLDDAFQHRRLNADLYILLCDYNRPIWKDFMLPSGNLRDNRIEKRRAGIIVISKCPETIGDQEMDFISKKLKLRSKQRLFFTKVAYGAPCPINELAKSKFIDANSKVVGLAGIAQPQAFETYLQQNFNEVRFFSFPDHHDFSDADVLEVVSASRDYEAIVLTEKDAMRWTDNTVPAFYVPIETQFIKGQQQFAELVWKAQKEKSKSRN